MRIISLGLVDCTNNAARFIDDEKFSLFVMKENFDRSQCNWGFVSVNYVPAFF